MNPQQTPRSQQSTNANPRRMSDFRRVPATPTPTPKSMAKPAGVGMHDAVKIAKPGDGAASPAETPAPDLSDVPETTSPALHVSAKSHKGWKIFGWIFALLIVAAIAVAGWGYYWYTGALKPIAASEGEQVRLTIENGATASDIATKLEADGAIRDARAFNLYYRFNHSTGLKAGVYLLNTDMSVQAIVAHLEEGEPDEFSLTFLPGATLADAKKILVAAGYAAEDVDKAFAASYDHPLLEGRPEGASIEGYLYGDTYNFYANSSLEDVLTRVFDHMYEDLQANKVAEAYKERGMTLYEGITFASIVQSEVSLVEDMPLVSQVFHKRLAEDMQLGSDVTFIYGARLLGVAPSVELDSPYNTRVLKGLPPTPISNPSLDALKAGAAPSDTDYLYFVAGDDGKTYFSRTNEEHEAATREHCHQNCILPQE